MHVDRVRDLEPEPLDRLVRSRMRAGRGRDSAGYDERRARRQAPPEHEPAKPAGLHRIRTAVDEQQRLYGHDHREPERREPEQEMRHDRKRVQVDGNRDRPEGDLGDDDEKGRERGSATGGGETHGPSGADPCDERERKPDERDQAIAELDERVKALLGIRLVAATRPVLAPEPRARQAHECARGDDEEERRRGRDRQAQEADRSDDKRARSDRGHYVKATPPPLSTPPMRAMKRPCGAERRLQHGAALRRERDEEAAGGLRVIGERQLRLRGGALHVRARVFAIPAIPARADPARGELARARKRRQRLRLDLGTYAASRRELVHMPEQAESGHVRDCVRSKGTERLGGFSVQFLHRRDGDSQRLLDVHGLARGLQDDPRPERLRQEERIARECSRLGPDRIGVNGAYDGQSVFRLGVADGVAAGEDRARRSDPLVRSGEHLAEQLRGKLLGKGRHRESEQGPASHREDVVQRVRRSDRAEGPGIVDERREEVDREDERPLVVEAVDRCVVGGIEPDQEVFGVRGHEAGQEGVQPGRRVFRRATAGLGQRRQSNALHLANCRGLRAGRGQPRGDRAPVTNPAGGEFRLLPHSPDDAAAAAPSAAADLLRYSRL